MRIFSMCAKCDQMSLPAYFSEGCSDISMQRNADDKPQQKGFQESKPQRLGQVIPAASHSSAETTLPFIWHRNENSAQLILV